MKWLNKKGDSGLIGDIPKSLRDGLSDALIAAYKEKREREQCRQDAQPHNTASPNLQDSHGESDP